MGAEAKDLFGSRRLKEVRDQEVVQASLYEEIGWLTMELDWVIKLQASAEEKRRWIDPGHPESKHPPPMRAAHNSTDLVWASPAASEAIKTVKSVAGTDATVLVTGETGTGKEAIARLIHALSARKNKALVKLDCTTIPANLAESELFGHEKGAFTGALSRKLGRFDLADGGTIFLDEIGELPLEVQAKLLRVLQEGKFERVGGTSTLAADVRVIAATHRDLAQLCREGRFRTDLFYRLHVFPIPLPPLRERREDIPLLVQHFTRMYAAKLGKGIATVPERMMTALCNYPWPGNIRELQHVIERAVILTQGTELALDNGFHQVTASPTPPRACYPGDGRAGAYPQDPGSDRLARQW